MENTISGIVGDIEECTVTNPKTVWSAQEIIDMYEEIESEEHYDVNDISTMICRRIMTGPQQSTESMCVMIYNIFDICKTHIRGQELAAFAKEGLDAAAKRSMDRLNYLK